MRKIWILIALFVVFFALNTLLFACNENSNDSIATQQNGTPSEISALDFYPLDDGTYGIKAGKTIYLSKVGIPATYNGKPVSTILPNAFDGAGNLIEISIPSSVTSIEDSAFYGCKNLSDIRYGGDVAGWCTISGLDNLMKYGESNKSLYCNGVLIEDLVFSEETTFISEYTFFGCSTLTSITGNATVVTAVSKQCRSREFEVNITSGTSIGINAFSNCLGLTTVVIPASVTYIGSGAFSGCSRLTSITIADGNVKYYSKGDCIIETETRALIAGCKNSVIPVEDGVTSISDGAFSGCRGLTSITIPDSVTDIGKGAFENCKELTSVIIGDNVTSIGRNAFANCKELTSVIIGDNVTSIGHNAFANCNGLTSVKIGDRVTSIGENAFSLCYMLPSIIIPDSVTKIDRCAFMECSELRNITIGAGLTNIVENAFSGCSCLSSIDFQGSMEQWNAITKGSSWNSATGNYTIHCTDGDIAKS